VIESQFILVLLENGRCSLHSKIKEQKPAFINLDHEEKVRSVFLNRLNDSIIIVSVRGEDNYNSLKCRSISIKNLDEAFNGKLGQVD